jgi:hypothetical protein
MVIALDAAVKLATVKADLTPANHCSAASLPLAARMLLYSDLFWKPLTKSGIANQTTTNIATINKFILLALDGKPSLSSLPQLSGK